MQNVNQLEIVVQESFIVTQIYIVNNLSLRIHFELHHTLQYDII